MGRATKKMPPITLNLSNHYTLADYRKMFDDYVTENPSLAADMRIDHPLLPEIFQRLEAVSCKRTKEVWILCWKRTIDRISNNIKTNKLSLTKLNKSQRKIYDAMSKGGYELNPLGVAQTENVLQSTVSKDSDNAVEEVPAVISRGQDDDEILAQTRCVVEQQPVLRSHEQIADEGLVQAKYGVEEQPNIMSHGQVANEMHAESINTPPDNSTDASSLLTGESKNLHQAIVFSLGKMQSELFAHIDAVIEQHSPLTPPALQTWQPTIQPTAGLAEVDPPLNLDGSKDNLPFLVSGTTEEGSESYYILPKDVLIDIAPSDDPMDYLFANPIENEINDKIWKMAEDAFDNFIDLMLGNIEDGDTYQVIVNAEEVMGEDDIAMDIAQGDPNLNEAENAVMNYFDLKFPENDIDPEEALANYLDEMFAQEQAREIKRIHFQIMKMKRKILRDTSNPFDDDPESFRKFYRLTPQVAFYLIDLIRDELEIYSETSVPAELQVLITLRFLAEGPLQKGVGNDWRHPVCQSLVSKILTRVLDAISNLRDTFIAFPSTPEERQRTQAGFHHTMRIHNILGLIDGVLVRFRKPHMYEEAYWNYREGCSMNVQFVVDSRGIIIGLRISPGSVNDQHNLNESDILQIMIANRNNPDIVANEGIYKLLGDSGYRPSPYMLTPIEDAAPGTPEALYTQEHTTTRSLVERTIGATSGVWMAMNRARKLYYSVEKVAQIIECCAILHNIRRLFRLPDPPLLNEVNNNDDELIVDDYYDDYYVGVAERNAIIDALYRN